ncbi:hypothetical protein OG943_21995 [Amycolatopsis sp. NBC_00345]|uniref:hypothetical protein n=1 Tax=Amycolatopsis sp. NBC_00345 TaxID=2975955 RepID=UPI002E2633FD
MHERNLVDELLDVGGNLGVQSGGEHLRRSSDRATENGSCELLSQDPFPLWRADTYGHQG